MVSPTPTCPSPIVRLNMFFVRHCRFGEEQEQHAMAICMESCQWNVGVFWLGLCRWMVPDNDHQHQGIHTN